MIFIFDIDDTISNTGKYGKEYILNYIKNNNLPYKQKEESVKYPEEQFDWTYEEAHNWYKEHGDEMLLSFPCFEGAIETINKLYETGHEIIFATARSTDWYNRPIETTRKWLKMNHIKYNKLYTSRMDKEKICELENANVFVDDDLNTCLRVSQYFEGSKNKVFLMNTCKDKRKDLPSNIIRIDQIKDIPSILKLDI